jgi:hypothetical protein
MIRPWIDRLKPAAPARTHLLLAAAMWSAVGGTLCVVGALWAIDVRTPATLWLLAIAAAAGWFKARLALEPAAVRIVGRIRERGDGRCLGGFLSPGTWMLVAVMAVGGRLLRGGVLSSHLVGLVYVVVGVGLLVASRLMWRAWLVADPEGAV